MQCTGYCKPDSCDMCTNKMKILTINAGSSSIKYSLFEDKIRLVKGIEERIGLRGGCKNHSEAIKKILKKIKTKHLIRKYDEIKAVGHRIVHGADITKTTKIDKRLMKKLKALVELAPLHEPPEIKCIEICQKILECEHYAIFDTSFHTSMDKIRSAYALPTKVAKKYNIKRYGFHGISHKYVAQCAAQELGENLSELKLITCHLGNGASITAIKNGKSFDTSMGFTPIEGLVMGSRCGDIDAGIVFFLLKKGYKKDTLYEMLNKESGLLGISGHRDMREILKSKQEKSKLALDVFCYRAAKYIGSYIIAMQGCDGIVFTAGIGENSWLVRQKILKYFEFLGVELDKNQNRKNECIITTERSMIKVLVIFTDEEQMMAEEVYECLC